MQNTRFMNASGLHNKYQKSTAKDMALLAIAIRRDFPSEYKIFNTKSFKWNGRKYNNHNNLLKSYYGTDGVKTGYIDASGFNDDITTWKPIKATNMSSMFEGASSFDRRC